MRNPIPGARRRVRRLVRGDVPLKIGSYVPPKGLRPLRPDEIAATDAFHRAYYDSWKEGSGHGRGTITLSSFGYRTLKSPLDLWTYQAILVETRPDLVVECGTRFGGSAYYIATLLDLIGHGRVLTVDVEAPKGRPVHRRISYLLRPSTDPRDRGRGAGGGRGQAGDGHPGLGVDSAAHVAGESAAYHDLVALGCYLIVEDTNVNGHPVRPDFGPWWAEALNAFLTGRDDFVSDPIGSGSS